MKLQLGEGVRSVSIKKNNQNPISGTYYVNLFHALFGTYNACRFYTY